VKCGLVYNIMLQGVGSPCFLNSIITYSLFIISLINPFSLLLSLLLIILSLDYYQNNWLLRFYI